MKKADNFDAAKWLVENKITTQSRLINENQEATLSPNMQKQFNMIVSALKKAKSEKDIDQIHTDIMLLPKKLTKIFIDKLVSMGLAEKEGDNRYSLSYDDGLDESKKTMRILNEDETTMIPPSIVSKYVRMKSLFGDKAGDMELITKIKPIVTEFFPKNLDVSFSKLANEFGEEAASGAITVLFGAYLDGRLDSFKDSITRLSDEKKAYYNKITTQSNLKEESSQFNGKNLDVYKENFKLLKTKETPKTTVYTFELPQEINDKAMDYIDKTVSDDPEYYKELYKKRNYFTITVPKNEGSYKPYGLYYPQGDALEDYLKTL